MAFKDPIKIYVGDKMALTFLCTGLLAFLFAIVVAVYDGELLKQQLPTSGGLAGPFEVKSSRSALLIHLSQPIAEHGIWNQVNMLILDEKKNYIFSADLEMWKEKGTDAEGDWEETNDFASFKYNFPEQGTFYLYLEGESNHPQHLGKMEVTVSGLIGSTDPFIYLGSWTMGLALLIFCITNMTWRDFLDG